MKKTFAIILIALMSMTFIFAGASSTVVAPVSTIGSETSTLQVEFQVNPDQVYYYAFGFTQQEVAGARSALTTEGPTNLPTAFKGTMGLNYDNGSATASSEPGTYFYYKANTNKNYTLTFTINADMVGDPAGSLGWGVTFAEDSSGTEASSKDVALGSKSIKSVGASSSISGDGSSYTATVSGETTNQNYGLYAITINTDKIKMLDATTTFTGALTVEIGTV